MLNVGRLDNGVVLDHIHAGRSMEIYYDLGLDKLNCSVAIIKNAHSRKMGRKDILKIEGGMDLVNLDIVGYIDPNITVNIIQNGEIAEKYQITLPKRLVNVLYCKNPRCITSEEPGLDHIFELSDGEEGVYRCIYCGEISSKQAHH